MVRKMVRKMVQKIVQKIIQKIVQSIFYTMPSRPAMFDFELEWTVGVWGGGRARRRLPEEAAPDKLRVTALTETNR